MCEIVLDNEIPKRSFIVLQQNGKIHSSDWKIAEALGISLEQYISRISKLDERFVLKDQYTYFNLEVSDEKNEKILVDKFKEEFVEELITLKLGGGVSWISKYK